jgi:hypothetical protein
MKMNQNVICAGLLTVLLVGWTARADLFQENDPQFGANSLTYDSRTGLTWLDLTFSQGLSFTQTLAAMEPGGQLNGFRYATTAEVFSLFNSAGFKQGFITLSNPGFEDINPLISLIGSTSADGTGGITGTLVDSGSEPAAELSYISFLPATDEYYVVATSGNTAYGLNTSENSIGNWLVAVPEPSTYALILAGGAWTLLLPGRKM